MFRTCILAFLGGGALVACGGDPDPCEGVEGTCVAIGGGASYDEVQTKLIEAEPGSTIAFGAGTYRFATGLSLDVDGVTIQGAGMDATILSFADQTDGAQGLLVTGDDVVIEDIAFEDAPGDNLKLEGSDGVTIRRVRSEWTNGPDVSNGAYAIYPVQCRNILIEDSVAIGASDAGLYVGQSENIIVRRSRAEYNVAGIEIENSTNADVYENEAVNNTGGILVFNLPSAGVINGAGTRVFNNHSHDNNTLNFAPLGNIVGKIPTGSGIILLAAHQVEIFDNLVENHDSVQIGMISYGTTGIEYDRPEFDPDLDTIYIHDNEINGVSENPTGEFGLLLRLAMGEVQDPFEFVPNIAWDGAVAADKADLQADPTGHTLAAEYQICIQNNGDADFGNLHWPNMEAPLPEFDLSPHDCAHEPLPEVVLE